MQKILERTKERENPPLSGTGSHQETKEQDGNEMKNENPKKLVAIKVEDAPVFCGESMGECSEKAIDIYGISSAFHLSRGHLECAVCGSGKVVPKISPTDEIWILDPLNYGSAKRITGRRLLSLLNS